ncbi:MAG: glutamate-5-semialdehyde dehydrogenase [Pseudomonadota bacterium]
MTTAAVTEQHAVRDAGAPARRHEREDPGGADLRPLGRAAREAARIVAVAPTEQKNAALLAAARELYDQAPIILDANARDVAAAKEAGMAAAYVDRLTLTTARINAMGRSLEEIAALDDPVGTVIAEWTRPNGLEISRVRTPLGVIGIIYESRPNVTSDAAGLCLKSGNAAILRCGSDSFATCDAILDALRTGLKEAGLPSDVAALVPTTDRAAVGHMLTGLNGAIDVIVPRGGRSLVERVQAEARVPVFAHLEGNCHIYVDRGADIDEAVSIILNAKLRRTGICGAAETVLIDQNGEPDTAARITTALLDAGCAVRGDAAVRATDERVEAATEADWATEYLDAIIAAKMVDGVDDAIAHIAQYGSDHTDAILTECYATAELFLNRVDSAIVMHNASTQFADGGEFGMGAEIGIATGRMHARGPVGVEQLTSFKYKVRGAGQVRPA